MPSRPQSASRDGSVLRYGAASTIRHAPVVVECAVLPPTPTPSAPAQSMEPVATTLVINACCEESRAVRRDATELISDLPARDNPRGRLARDQCIPPGALLTGGLGEAKI